MIILENVELDIYHMGHKLTILYLWGTPTGCSVLLSEYIFLGELVEA